MAEHVLKQGDQVVRAARTVASMEALAAPYPNTALAVTHAEPDSATVPSPAAHPVGTLAEKQMSA